MAVPLKTRFRAFEFHLQWNFKLYLKGFLRTTIWKKRILTLKSFGMSTLESLRELGRLLVFLLVPSSLACASWFFNLSLSSLRTAFDCSSFFWLSKMASSLLFMFSIKSSCLSWAESYLVAILRSKEVTTTKRYPPESMISANELVNNVQWKIKHPASVVLEIWLALNKCHAHKDWAFRAGARGLALPSEALATARAYSRHSNKMAEFFSSDLLSSCQETPVTLLTINKCDTCGKSFEHSSSYRRHSRTECTSQSRKRRRKLWLPDELDEGHEHDEVEDVGVAPLLDSSLYETEGNILLLFPCACTEYWSFLIRFKIALNRQYYILEPF